MKTIQDKTEIINQLTDKLNNSNVFYITDIGDLDAEQTYLLRSICFKENLELKVVKNTLLKKALEKTGRDYEDMFDTLEGPSSIIFAETGNAPAKMIKEIRKKHKLEKPLIKAAYVEEAVYIGDDQLEALCNIKSKTDLIAELVGLLQSPMKNVVSALQSGQNTITGVLETLSNKEED